MSNFAPDFIINRTKLHCIGGKVNFQLPVYRFIFVNCTYFNDTGKLFRILRCNIIGRSLKCL